MLILQYVCQSVCGPRPDSMHAGVLIMEFLEHKEFLQHTYVLWSFFYIINDSSSIGLPR